MFERCWSCGDPDHNPDILLHCRLCEYPQCVVCQARTGDVCEVCIMYSQGFGLSNADKVYLREAKQQFYWRCVRRRDQWCVNGEIVRRAEHMQQRRRWMLQFRDVVVDLHACYLQFMPYRLGDWLEGIKTFSSIKNLI